MASSISSIRGPVKPLDAARLADRDAVLQLCQIYALSVDTRDEKMFRSIFSPTAKLKVGLGEYVAEEYPPILLNSLKPFTATMHAIHNQYAVFDGDEADVRSYAVAYHVYEPSLGLADLVMGVHYNDRVGRGPNGWWIIGRESKHVWIRGPMPPKPQS